MATTSASGPHTKAWTTFNQNLESIDHVVHLVRRELDTLETKTTRFKNSVDRLTTEIARLRTSVGTSPDLRLPPLKKALAKLTRVSERHKKTSQPVLERMGTLHLWQVVMLVTCVEAYLQDLLALAANVDRKLMAHSNRIVLDKDVISAPLLEDLVSGICTQWARGWLRDKPKEWIKSLKKMGVTGYPDDLAPRLKLIWEIRHVVVHSAGIATADFVKRCPGVVAAAGDRVQVGSKNFKGHLESVRDLMEPTDRHFGERYPSLLA